MIWLLGFAVFLTVYLIWIRPRQLRWGAADEELAMVMPGDSIVTHPHFNATRAVTVKACPKHLYPWVVQMGLGRGGWYSYDLIDNLAKPSSKTILPEFQNIKRGMLIPMSPDQKLGIYVLDYQYPDWILWGDKKGENTWLWLFNQKDEEHTRLITRVRLHYNWLSPDMIFNLALDAGDIIMMRKCLFGIKERAEALAAQKEI